MNEEIEYAEMLEIPVSTVNVVRKKRQKSKRKTQPPFYPNETGAMPNIKDTVIAQVNDRVFQTPQEKITAEAALFAEGANSAGDLRFEDIPQRIDTIRLYGENDRPYFDDMPQDYERDTESDYIAYEGERTGAERKLRKLLGAEFAIACVLCGGIFLTNVFVSGSAINTFFRSLSNTAQIPSTDTRGYADFTLSGVVNDYTDVEITLSNSGVLTFQTDCCVYPATDGKVSEVILTDGGTYTVKIGHSDSFTGVIEGLNQVYYQVGEEVKANVPVGYTTGETPVQVTMYSDGVLLNCFQITEENCLAWVEQK